MWKRLITLLLVVILLLSSVPAFPVSALETEQAEAAILIGLQGGDVYQLIPGDENWFSLDGEAILFHRISAEKYYHTSERMYPRYYGALLTYQEETYSGEVFFSAPEGLASEYGVEREYRGDVSTLTEEELSLYFWEIIVIGNNDDRLDTILSAFHRNAFNDVAEDAWYAPYISFCANHGVMVGVGDRRFEPERYLTEAEFQILAERLRAFIGDTDSCVPATGNMEPLCSRIRFAAMLAAAVHDLPEINVVDTIPDLLLEKSGQFPSEWIVSVYRLYHAGILTGTDAQGHFSPDRSLTRAEAATMLSRVLEPSLRRSFGNGI